jgi:hypothetical protein
MDIDGMEKGYRTIFWAVFGAILLIGVINGID